MLIPAPIKFRRQHRPIKAPPANQILKVSHTSATNKLSVIITGNLVDLSFTQAMQAFDGTTWHSSSGGNFDNLPEVQLSFGVVHVDSATQWRIVDPSVWVFEDARSLMPAYGGAIA